ncbi:MAG: hypothetical protein KIT84_01710 [Labilithrix sp.]|nr:hypothetical protein [Labilithrix sp.]MCW5809703.1 hypothetical protein [Labilithrix sp.]
MSALRLTALVLALVACGDTDEPAASDQQHTLSVAGDGMPAPPDPLGAPIPAPRDLPAPRPFDGDLRDPLGPEGVCEVGYLKIYDPVRARPIDVPIVVCN